MYIKYINNIYSYLKSLSPLAHLYFRLNKSEYPLSATPQACIIIPDLLILHMVGEEGEGGTARTEQEGGKERRGEDVKAERGATPSDGTVAMPKKPGENTKTNAAARMHAK